MFFEVSKSWLTSPGNVLYKYQFSIIVVLYCLNIVVTRFNQHSVEWDCVNRQIAVFIFGSPVSLFCSFVAMYPVFCVFWILRNVNFCVFRSFKVLVDISWKCVVKISIQHYCGTLLFAYCSNKV